MKKEHLLYNNCYDFSIVVSVKKNKLVHIIYKTVSLRINKAIVRQAFENFEKFSLNPMAVLVRKPILVTHETPIAVMTVINCLDIQPTYLYTYTKKVKKKSTLTDTK